MAISEKSKLQTEHENFQKHIQDLKKRTRIPKYLTPSIERSIAQKYNCVNVKGYWVQLYAVTKGDKVIMVPHDQVLKDLEMTREEFLNLNNSNDGKTA